MSQFESSEIMVNYALSMQKPASIRKNAADKTKALGELAWLLPDILAPIAAMTGTAAVTGLAVLGSTPIAIGAAILGLTYGLYSLGAALASANNEIKDLIDKMEALDYSGDNTLWGLFEGDKTSANDIIVGWLTQLKELSEKLNSMSQIKSSYGLDNSEKRIFKAKELVRALSIYNGGLELVMSIDKEWKSENVREHLNDWGGPLGDISSFEETLEKVITNYTALVKDTGAKSRAAGAEVYKNTKGSDAIMKNIDALYREITSIWAAPALNDIEKEAVDFGKTIGTGGVDAELLLKYLPVLIQLRKDLKTVILPEAKKRSKKTGGAILSRMSKRAVSLPDARTAPPQQPQQQQQQQQQQKQPGSKFKPISKRFKIQQNDVVGNMQMFLNSLGVALDAGAPWLNIDSKYGPNTAKALELVLGKISELDADNSYQQLFRRIGIPLNKVNDWAFMNKNPSIITRITRELREITKTVRKSGPSGVAELAKARLSGSVLPAPKQTQKQQNRPGAGAYNDRDLQGPSDAEILKHFKASNALIGGVSSNLYDFAINRKMNDAGIIKMINDNFPGYAPSAWPLNSIPKLIGRRYSVFGTKSISRHISKQAFLSDQQSQKVKNMVVQFVDTVWEFESGPFENIFRLIPYAAIPLLGGMGNVIKSLLVMAATRILKISPADFGAEIDRYFKLGPNDDPLSITEGEFEKGVNEILGLSNYSKAYTDNSISKRAFGAGAVARVLWWATKNAIPMLASIFVFSHLGEFTEKHLGMAREAVGEKLDPIKRTKEFVSVDKSSKKPKVTKKLKSLDDIENKDEMIDYVESKYGPTGDSE